MRVARCLGAVALFALGGHTAACTSESPRVFEPLGVQRQAHHSSAHLGIARKVCQIVGEKDFETGAPTKAISNGVQ
jgi:hypothetical protein